MFTESLLNYETEIHIIKGVAVKVFGIARKIADCFR